MTKPFNYEDRLVIFAGECVLFLRTLKHDQAGIYYADQLLRASGSAALHYGEAQGTATTRDFIHKVSGTLKELKECRTILKILQYLRYGDSEKLQLLTIEVKELIPIAAKMVINKKSISNS